ncbi:hypothetical protein NDU88_001982 [Pleurodeles waltl]|uniref:Uncharacterized protein n=1 Tax=Pleurodeles waltl TaxID=8319 RepID=A0AAV7PAB5_PLEWA|nr:hypothetical protein NDU88_001982 [Pleurodeles waltl]
MEESPHLSCGPPPVLEGALFSLSRGSLQPLCSPADVSGPFSLRQSLPGQAPPPGTHWVSRGPHLRASDSTAERSRWPQAAPRVPLLGPRPFSGAGAGLQSPAGQ